MSILKDISIVIGGLAVVVGLTAGASLIETNNAGYMQVKQAAISGNMSVKTDPGMYLQNFGDIFTYKISDTYSFDNQPITVRFNDGATAAITGQIKFKLPAKEKDVLKLHNEFRSYEAVHTDLVRQVVAATLKQSATHFGAEEVYSTRRGDFINLVLEQVKEGLYATEYEEKSITDSEGNSKIIRVVSKKLDKNGVPIINEPSAFETYNVDVIQLVIKEIDFDDKTDQLISARKKSEQEEILAKAEAKKAKQDAIKAEEQGKANVAREKYKALVEKESAVIKAEKEKEVAEQLALKAEEEKKAIILKGEAEAEAARLKVAAGLSPREQAEFDRDTAIGVARELSKVRLPQIMVSGGSDADGTKVNPFDAVGLQALMDLNKKMIEGNK